MSGFDLFPDQPKPFTISGRVSYDTLELKSGSVLSGVVSDGTAFTFCLEFYFSNYNGRLEFDAPSVELSPIPHSVSRSWYPIIRTDRKKDTMTSVAGW
jgi:hypothetical protein